MLDTNTLSNQVSSVNAISININVLPLSSSNLILILQNIRSLGKFFDTLLGNLNLLENVPQSILLTEICINENEYSMYLKFLPIEVAMMSTERIVLLLF